MVIRKPSTRRTGLVTGVCAALLGCARPPPEGAIAKVAVVVNGPDGRTQHAEGTGFLINAPQPGYVATAFHLFERPRKDVDGDKNPTRSAKFKVQFHGHEAPNNPNASFRAGSGTEDWMVLYVSPEGLKANALEATSYAGMEAGSTPVTTIGYPEGNTLTHRHGVINSFCGTTDPPLPGWTTDMWIAHGQSGSPVLDPAGRVIGMAVDADEHSDDRVGYVIPIDKVLETYRGPLARMSEDEKSAFCNEPTLARYYEWARSVQGSLQVGAEGTALWAKAGIAEVARLGVTVPWGSRWFFGLRADGRFVDGASRSSTSLCAEAGWRPWPQWGVGVCAGASVWFSGGAPSGSWGGERAGLTVEYMLPPALHTDFGFWADVTGEYLQEAPPPFYKWVVGPSLGMTLALK
jgi:V8-like Glu-specific endopeptidase